MDQHRRRALDDVLLQHERQDLEQRLAIGVGERVAEVGGELAKIGARGHASLLVRGAV
jgi:hypothetical protein